MVPAVLLKFWVVPPLSKTNIPKIDPDSVIVPPVILKLPPTLTVPEPELVARSKMPPDILKSPEISRTLGVNI